MYLVVFHLDSGWKFSEFNIKKEVFKWPNLILNVCGCWFICRIASDASNVRSCKARPRWGNERTWSGIERTLHCTINITDHLLHIKHFKKIVTGWEKFEGFQDFLRMLVFVSILQAQKCKNYGKPLDSGVCGLAKLLPPCIVRQEWIYIVHYTSHNIHMCVLSTTGGNCTISACDEATLHNMCVFYSPPYATLHHLRQRTNLRCKLELAAANPTSEKLHLLLLRSTCIPSKSKSETSSLEQLPSKSKPRIAFLKIGF